ncbi:unnamed protein product [Ixodes persulcatus]
MTSTVTLLGTCNKVYIFGNVRLQSMYGWQKYRAGCAGISNRKVFSPPMLFPYLDIPAYQMEGKETESTKKSSTFIRSIPE